MAGSASVSMTTHSSPARGAGDRLAGDDAMLEDPDHDDHYIYVTYPPELKRRLLERYAKNITFILLTPFIRQTTIV